MQGKNNNQKLRTKSAGIHNIIITNKAIKPNKNNKSNKFAQLKGKRAIPDLKNEKVISNINIEKAFSLNSNYRTNNNKKPTKGNNNKSNKRSKSFNLIQRVKKDNQGSNKKKQIINNINVNINHINNIHISKKEIDLSIRNKSFGKIMNTNKAKKPSTNYNAFKIKPKNNNKISKTEEKNGLKQSPAINQIPKSNLFSNFQKKEKKSVNSTIFSKLNNKNNNHPVSAKSTLNKNTKKYSIGKIINQRPKNILKKNLSIENNNKKPKQSINKIPPKDKIMHSEESFKSPELSETDNISNKNDIQQILFSDFFNLIILIPDSIRDIKCINLQQKKFEFNIEIKEDIFSANISQTDGGKYLIINLSKNYPKILLYDLIERKFGQKYYGHIQKNFKSLCSFGGKTDQYILCASEDFLIYLWDRNISGLPKYQFKGHEQRIIGLSMVNSSLILSCDENEIKIWTSYDIDDVNFNKENNDKNKLMEIENIKEIKS